MLGALVCLAAPWWVRYLQVIGGHNSFLTADAVVLLGMALLGGLAGAAFLPDDVTGFAEKAFRRVLAKPVVYGCAGLLVLLLLIVAVNKLVLHSFLGSADEHSCYFLAECLRKGKLFVSSPPLSEFFNVVHVGNKGGKWFSVYPPGWPLIWSFGLRWGIVDWLNPVMSTLSIVFFYKAARRVFSPAAAWLGLFLAAITPFFLFTSASYFSHSTCLLAIAVFLYAFVEWQNSDREAFRICWAVVVAFAVGYGLMTRYLTMFAIAAPFLLYHFMPVFLRRRKWSTSDTVVVVILALFTAVILYQNYAVSGKPFRAPNQYDKSWERLGFRKNYTPLDGIIFFVTRLFYLADWMPAAFVALFLIAVLAKRKFNAVQQLFRYGFVLIAGAYFFYFSWGGNQFGPRYYYEGVLFLGIASAEYLIHRWRSAGCPLKKFMVCAVFVSLLANIHLLIKQAVYYEEVTRQRKDLYELAESSLRDPAIVFIKGFIGDKLVMAEEDAVRNSPYLDTRILYAHDLGVRNPELMALYPERKYYRGSYDRARKTALIEKLNILTEKT